MITIRKVVLLLAISLIVSGPLALAQGTYTQIDVPGSQGTFCFGIDTAGDVVGAYYDDAGQIHGVLLSGGTYTTIDYPGAPGTELTGINDMGQIVGLTTSNPPIGFLYDIVTQSFATISYPRAIATYPYAINNVGTVAGYYTMAMVVRLVVLSWLVPRTGRLSRRGPHSAMSTELAPPGWLSVMSPPYRGLILIFCSSMGHMIR